jgi:hypothetical protein
MATKNYANEHPKYQKVSTRERLQKDWKSYSKLTDLLYFAPPVLQDKPGSYTGSGRSRDEEETRLKERFMYGKSKIKKHIKKKEV